MTANVQEASRISNRFEQLTVAACCGELVLLSLLVLILGVRDMWSSLSKRVIDAKSSNELKVHGFRRLDRHPEDNSVTNWTKCIRLKS